MRRVQFGFLILIVLWVGPRILSAWGAEVEKPWVAKIGSIQGHVEARLAGTTHWATVKIEDTYKPGDMIRLHENSRASIVLPNDTILRLDQNTTITLSAPEKETTWIIDILRGAVYFFSRIPRTLKIATPFVNGSTEGTEFLIMVESDRALLSVFEGKLLAENQAGTLALASGQTAVALANQAPTPRLEVRPRDAVRWALYYPFILHYQPKDFQGGAEGGWEAMVRRSMEYYWQGDVTRALSAIGQIGERVEDSRFFIYRAGLFLSVGRTDKAKLDLERALRLDPSGGDAFALQSIVALTQNQKDEAIELARKADRLSPVSPAAKAALCYAQQAHFDLQSALSSMEESLRLDPGNALTWARIAELHLSLGYLDRALQAAQEAASLNPHLARTQTVLGFAYLTQIKTKESREAFEKAIVLDQADPLPRLGLGLTRIRDGHLDEGRGDIEIAVSLDPNNSLMRSYLGKAYYEEKRDKLAVTQFELAKELDPMDPTPWFYDAIQKQTMNRPVEALHDLQKSIELNDNRAVYRSRLLLDQDLAARSASLGRIYQDLGFEQLALVEGWKSVNTDPASFSAHRFLAEYYLTQPRHEIARVSEVLQTQLLQPININPVPPVLAESNLFILSSAGPRDLSFNEYNPLFNRNRLALQVSGIAGEHDTLGDEIIQSGVWGKFSYSLGQFHYETDGFRENNDLKNNIYNVFGQYNLSEKTSVQAEFRSTEVKKGDLTLRFFPDDFLPNLRDETTTKSVRLGFRHGFSPQSDLIGYAMYQNGKNEVSDMPDPLLAVRFKTNSDNYSGELQHLFRSEIFNLVSGVGYFHINRRDVDAFSVDTFSESTEMHSNVNHTNLYIYSQINYLKSVSLTVGGSADFFRGGIIDRDQFNPKLGLTWTVLPGTVLRGAVFRTFKRTLLTNQTLEPTQVAGFNQFLDDTEGTEAWRYGLAVDQKITGNIYGGVEISKRDLTVPIAFFDVTQVVKEADWNESMARAYLYWAPHSWLALNAEYQYEELQRERNLTFNTAENVRTHRVPLGVSFFHPSGFIAKVRATYVHQKGDFQPQGSDVTIPGEDDFWTVDAGLGYRLPRRYGMLSLEAKNLFDKSFKCMDIDEASPMMQPKRLVLFKFTLCF
jgi:tetratricopeptide (TPR) repeat protein